MQVNLAKPSVPTPARLAALGNKLPDKLVVVCVWWGDKYGSFYVQRLRNMVEKYLTFVPFEFVCITRNDTSDLNGVTIIPPMMGDSTHTWWQKVGLFHPNLFGPRQRVLYLDLDIVIKNSLYDVVRAEDPFVMCDNFGPNRGYCAHNSSVMLWTPSPELARIQTQFDTSVMKKLHGDQDWIWRVMRENITCFHPNNVQSYKYDTVTDRSSIVVFHGEPKQTQVKEAWVTDNWR